MGEYTGSNGRVDTRGGGMSNVSAGEAWPMNTAPEPRRHGVYPDEAQRGMEDEFAAAFAAEIADEPIAPRSAARSPSFPATKKLAMNKSRRDDVLPDLEASLHDDLEAALRGLSAPHRPRDNQPARAEAFAPERDAAEYGLHGASAEADDFDELIQSELAAMRQFTPAPAGYRDGGHSLPTQTRGDYYDDAVTGAEPSRRPAQAAAPHAQAGYEEVDDAYAPAARGTVSGGRGLGSRIGAGLGVVALALAGATGSYFMLFGNSSSIGSGAPLLVKAELDPVKVAPKDPGGRSIPNQNKAVYERVQSAGPAARPSQAELLTAVEEPIELPQDESMSALPGVDLDPIDTASGPVRLANASVSDAEGNEVAMLQPRRVRTMTVRPDGTLVMGEEAPASQPAPELQDVAARGDDLAALSAAPASRLAPADSESLVGDMLNEAPAPAAPMPASNPRRSAPQPTEVASIEPVAPPAAPAAPETPAAAAAVPLSAEGYYVQISSQPSEAAAQASSRDLSRKFAGTLGARPVTIQSAAIPGKGTFYRVRVVASSKNEATELCTALKSAGGSCFVSR